MIRDSYPPHNFSNRSIRECYLPQHLAVNPNKPGKVRRVLNGASKFHGTTLCSFSSVFVNIILLYRLTLKECSYKSASFQRTNLLFVFCGGRNPTADVVVHQYTRHIFGARVSPTCANYALQRTAMDNQAMFPDAASAVLEKFYMDDNLESFENTDVAFKMSQELITLLSLGGFTLTKFISNVTKINKELNPPQSAPKHELKKL